MKLSSKSTILNMILITGCILGPEIQSQTGKYIIVDTGQNQCYDTWQIITPPAPGNPYYGQDAQYTGNQPSYIKNGDGTITDLNTGLMWQQAPILNDKMTFVEAVDGADIFDLAGYEDWRLPSIKELYSLIDFRGSSALEIPYIDIEYFDFAWGDVFPGERVIDAQYWSSNEYVGTTMNGDATVFGVNFADGRIKGYPRDTGPGGYPKEAFVRYVRGNPEYGINKFIDNGDGTITDQATGLMWMEEDSKITLNWEASLEYCENLEYNGYDDWRLPNAKELQSIVEYTRAPDAADVSKRTAAIDPIFEITEMESWFWTGTTLQQGSLQALYETAVYVTFGQAWGYMSNPYDGTMNYINVHGAGAQRSDPKAGDPADFPTGRGPQGDEIRIFNYVRAVRDVGSTTSIDDDKRTDSSIPSGYSLEQNYPNPFNPDTNISFTIPSTENVKLLIYNNVGNIIVTLVDKTLSAGFHQFNWDALGLPSGTYIYRLKAGSFSKTRKMLLLS